MCCFKALRWFGPEVIGAALLATLTAAAAAGSTGTPERIVVTLTEWKVELTQSSIPAGEVRFEISNTGSIPHAFEVEGQGGERETAHIPPGGTATLALTLAPGTYEVYCPVGEDSHKKLGMEARLVVEGGPAAPVMNDHSTMAQKSMMDQKPMGGMETPDAHGAQTIQVTGSGPVVQILPGPFPFIDSAAPILQAFGEEHEALESQAQEGPYSNNVAVISGHFGLRAWDLGSVRDSVSGEAEFTAKDGTRWRVVIDRVFTKDVPHHPKFGGVIMGLYYHGATQVHTPLVPTINSAVALWALAHLYRNGTLVTDQAMVHVMLLSRTRRDGDFALQCWDCARQPIEELQLQVTPAPGEPKFAAPGGFLFVNWERSRWSKIST